IGVKKSVVTTRARESSSRHTAASSGAPNPTNRSGLPADSNSDCSGRSTCASDSALSLEAQPAQLARLVRRTCRPDVALIPWTPEPAVEPAGGIVPAAPARRRPPLKATWPCDKVHAACAPPVLLELENLSGSSPASWCQSC